VTRAGRSRGTEELVEAARKAGWRVVEGKHVIVYPKDPTKAPVVLARTPSDHRAYMNSRARLRRAGLDV
jgi:hypothetical protein